MSDILSLAIIYSTIRLAAPLLLAAMGGLFSERSGVVNIALEGIMLTSAFAGYAGAFATHNLWFGLLIAVLAGWLYRSSLRSRG